MKDRKLLMIPGPIEFTPEVMRAMGMPMASYAATASDILATVGAIEKGLAQTAYSFEPGVGLAAAQAMLVA